MTPNDQIPTLRLCLDDLRRDLRRAIDAVDDPQGKALLEVSAEVLGGLITAFEHYRDKSEPAWQALAKRLFP